MRVIVLPRAREQLKSCARWWRRKRPSARRQVHPEFRRLVKDIVEHPYQGVEYERREGLRCRRIDGTPYYVFYEVSLEWQDEKTLVGRGVFKEKLTAHQYEAQVGWKMQIEGDRILRCQAEEVGWSEDHQEIYRDWVDYTFTRE